MSSVVHEEFTAYQGAPKGLPDESILKAEAGVDWDAYDRRMDARLRSAVEGCASGVVGTPIEDSFEVLFRRQAERRACAIA